MAASSAVLLLSVFRGNGAGTTGRMASGARSASTRERTTGRDGLDGRGHDAQRRGLTPAQLYCLLGGLALLLAGLLGFLADATFDTSGSTDTDRGGNGDGQLQGDSFLGFEVNGWHNLVHLLSGLVLLPAFRRRGTAKTVAIAFGAVYGLVTLIGVIDGIDVLGVLPVNPADNILHLGLSALGLLTGFMSPGDDRRGVPGRA